MIDLGFKADDRISFIVDPDLSSVGSGVVGVGSTGSSWVESRESIIPLAKRFVTPVDLTMLRHSL